MALTTDVWMASSGTNITQNMKLFHPRHFVLHTALYP